MLNGFRHPNQGFPHQVLPMVAGVCKARHFLVFGTALALFTFGGLSLRSAPAPATAVPTGPPHPKKLLTIPRAGDLLAYSPDGKRLLTIPVHVEKGPASLDELTGKEVRLVGISRPSSDAVMYGARTGKELARVTASEHIDSLAFSPDSRTVALGQGGWGRGGATENAILLAEGIHGKRLAFLKGHTGRVIGIAFSPDGCLLASGAGDKTVRVWDVKRRKERWTGRAHRYGVWAVAFSPDGKTIASSDRDDTIVLWDAESGKVQQRLKAAGDMEIGSVAFSPDGTLLASAEQQPDKEAPVPPRREEKRQYLVRLWDTRTGKEIHRFKQPAGVAKVAFGKVGRLLAVGRDDGKVVLIGLRSRTEVALLHHEDQVRDLTFSPDGTKLAVVDEGLGGIVVWDLWPKKTK